MKLRFDKVPFVYREKQLRTHGAEVNMFIMTMDPNFANNEGLYQHELLHIKQWYLCTAFFGVLWVMSSFVIPWALPYLFPLVPLGYRLIQLIPPVHLWVEVSCYARQLSYSLDFNRDLELFSEFIATRYNTGVTKDKAKQLLLSAYNK